MPTHEGSLVLADISGFTQFLATTELEHSRGIVGELLEVIVRSVKGRLTVIEVEGDAVFCVGDRTDPVLLAWFEETFAAFHRRVRDIAAVTTCSCRACVNVGSLALKFVAHRGEYVHQRIGDHEKILGSDVNLAHRLLKNSVPSREYILATQAMLDRWPAGWRHDFVGHSEEYEHFGRVPVAYRELQALRERARAEERTYVEPGEARMRTSDVFLASRSAVWRMLTDPRLRQSWEGVEEVDLQHGARGTMLGAEYHCHHGATRGVTVTKVVSYREPEELTTAGSLPAATVYTTSRLTEEGPERTRVDGAIYWDRRPGVSGALGSAILAFVLGRRARRERGRMVRILEELGKAAAPTPQSPDEASRKPNARAGALPPLSDAPAESDKT